MNPASTRNMSARDIPSELQRNAERRERREAVEHLLNLVKIALTLLVIAVCLGIRACSK